MKQWQYDARWNVARASQYIFYMSNIEGTKQMLSSHVFSLNYAGLTEQQSVPEFEVHVPEIPDLSLKEMASFLQSSVQYPGKNMHCPVKSIFCVYILC